MKREDIPGIAAREFISGRHLQNFATLGINDLFQDATRHRTMAWFFVKGSSRQQVPTGIGLSRFALDQGLSLKFQQLGGT
jgi:hypothetical protein